MDVMWIKTGIMLLTLIVLLTCVQAAPVINGHADTPESKGSGNQATETNANNLRDNQNYIENNNNNNDNVIHINNDVKPPNLSPSSPLAKKVQGQRSVTPAFPLLESLQPLVKTTGNENGGSNEISKEFTRKVLQAFFNELKNRPDLVDEILRRETYKLLMTIAQEDSDYTPLPADLELTQELVPEPAVQREEQGRDESKNPTSITETILPEGKEISKKSSQENVKAESLKTQSNIPSGDGTHSQTAKMQSALTKQLDKLGHSSGVSLKNDDTTSQNKVDSGLSQQLLIDPYYYYVYYDENEVPNSSSADKKENSHQPPVSNSNKNGDKEAQKVDKVNTDPQQPLSENSPVPRTDKTRDVVVDKIALAVRSVITRDMEKQLANSRLALNNNLVPNYNNAQALPLPDVKVVPTGQKSTQTTNQSSDEETELRNLTQ